MSYASIAAITKSASLFDRLTACAATEGAPKPYVDWVYERIWDLAATPGWASAWASAVANGDADPGANESVITDQMILSAVQARE